jgi:hypothetical protein
LKSINDRKFLPVCRFADGEFIFMNNGFELIDYRLKIKDKILRNKNNALDIINNKKFIPEYVKSIGETYRDEFGNYIFSKFI